ncbi:MAG: 3-oxoacyl-ACP reductase FabG [Dehalococcoidia bacterium]|nr:3-oxoacyl-ACP reductase FabG [Dehalococcoidia bacterium]
MMTTDALNRFSLNDRVAIVTGSASGIGRAIAVVFAQLGARLVIADKDLRGAEKIADEICSARADAMAVNVDVTVQEEVDRMVKSTLARFGRIDILVNNAGMMASSTVLDMKEANLDKTLKVNLVSVALCSQAVAGHFIERRSGKIVNIGSSLSSRASVCNLSGGGADYCASKAAVQAFTRALAMELAPHNVNVNAVAPGITNTPMHTGLWDVAVAYYQNSVPLGRLAEPEEIADVAAFLASDAARYITGQTIHVNGGQIMVD